MSAWELPTTVEVAGRSFAIRSDFRAVLDALAALTDPDLTQQEQYVACLQILYPRWKELPDANAALRAAFTFINEGKEDEKQGFRPRLVDWEQDAALRAYKMMLIRIGTYAIDDTQYFPCDNPDTTRTYTDTISVDGYEYTPALNHYRQWDSFYSTLRSIFTESFLDSDYLSSDGVTYFRPIEGNMYYISTERGFDPGYNQDSTLMDFSLREDTPDKIVIQVTATYAIDESSSQAFRQAVLDGLISNTKNYSIALVRGDDGWRFSQFDVPY